MVAFGKLLIPKVARERGVLTRDNLLTRFFMLTRSLFLAGCRYRICLILGVQSKTRRKELRAAKHFRRVPAVPHQEHWESRGGHTDPAIISISAVVHSGCLCNRRTL